MMMADIGGDASFVEEPTFAVHSPLPIAGMGRILGIRYQDACIDDFNPEDVKIIGGSTDDTVADTAQLINNTDPSCPVSVVFIERSADDGLATITHAYTPVPAVAQYLHNTKDAVLIEDAAFLSFLIAGGSDATSSLLLRSGFHKRLKPVHEENRRLKAELKAMKLENSQLRSVIASSSSNASAAIMKGRNTSVHTVASTNNATSTSYEGGGNSSQPHSNSNSPYRTASPTLVAGGGGDEAISIHSPHQWEMETEAAINARTRYNPYRDEAAKAKRRANRHAESVAQLVARLHDKSCDDRDKRLASYEALIDAENERYNEKKTLTYDDQRELGARLHDASRAHKKKMMDTLEREVYPPEERRTFDSEAIAKSNDRIYRQPMEKKQKGMEKLLQMYIYDQDDKLPKMKLGKDQQQAMADRLSVRHR